uniref:Uncharacterized protein n=1 Tax=Oryza brachyantha TaxID=4533 RepID=J3LM90_ORYBR
MKLRAWFILLAHLFSNLLRICGKKRKPPAVLNDEDVDVHLLVPAIDEEVVLLVHIKHEEEVQVGKDDVDIDPLNVRMGEHGGDLGSLGEHSGLEQCIVVEELNVVEVDPGKYRDISSGFGVLLQEQGLGGFFKGWMATLVGYSSQGACKFGFYEFFKKCYSDIAGPEHAEKWKTFIYLAASASAELIADVALCPMEAVKVRVQTQPGFARCLTDGFPKIVQSEGFIKD